MHFNMELPITLYYKQRIMYYILFSNSLWKQYRMSCCARKLRNMSKWETSICNVLFDTYIANETLARRLRFENVTMETVDSPLNWQNLNLIDGQYLFIFRKVLNSSFSTVYSLIEALYLHIYKYENYEKSQFNYFVILNRKFGLHFNC